MANDNRIPEARVTRMATPEHAMMDYRGQEARRSMEAFEARRAAHPNCERCGERPSEIGSAKRVLCRSCHAAEQPARPTPTMRRAVPSTSAATRRDTGRGLGPTALDRELANIDADLVALERHAKRGAGADRIIGYVAVWGDVGQREGDTHFFSYSPYSFREYLASGREIVAKLNHNEVVGTTRDGSLRLFENDYGLSFELRPYATDVGERALLCAGAGSITGTSKGVWNLDCNWPSGKHQEVTRAALQEITLLTGHERPTFGAGWAALATPANRAKLEEQARTAWRG